MSAKERDAAIAAGSLGLQLSEWVEREFRLPKPNIIDFSYETDPEAAARSLRRSVAWRPPLGGQARQQADVDQRDAAPGGALDHPLPIGGGHEVPVAPLPDQCRRASGVPGKGTGGWPAGDDVAEAGRLNEIGRG